MDEMNQLKVFTVEEASRLIPEMTERLTELQGRQRDILAKEVGIDALEVLYPSPEEGKMSSEVAREVEIYNEGVNRFYSLIDEIHEKGCLLKDIQMGLVDFYTLYRGKIVYLCWKLGESEIGYWHEVGRGYSYRQPLLREDEKESSG